jgi:hypothetical protein
MPALQIRTCILCEDVRFERRGIVSLMGAYGSVPDAVVYVRHFDKPVKLCFGFFVGPTSGKFVFEAEILSPDNQKLGKSTPPNIEMVLDSEKGSTFFAFWINNIIFSSPNRYSVVVRVDGVERYKDTFRVAMPRADVPF